MSAIRVTQVSGDRYRIAIRGHEVTVDQPTAALGTDAGPTPTELFVAGLASCVAFYAGRFLRRHTDSDEPLGVSCDFRMSEDKPARVEAVELTLDLPVALPEEVRAGVLRAAEHCTVHNSLRMPPEVRIGAREPAAAY